MDTSGRGGGDHRARVGVRVAVFAWLLVAPACAAAQRPPEPTVVGVVAGWGESRALWKPEQEGSSVGGVVLGGYADARTPISWFSLRAEILWSQRGGDVLLSSSGSGPLQGGVRGDYLTVSVRPRVTLGAGRFRLHLAAGPVYDQAIRRRVDSALALTLNREIGAVFGVLAGAGVGTTLGGRYRVELEARVYEGLGDAFSGDFQSARFRTFEVVSHIGIPRPR